jgi:hypothetical protein
VIDRAGRLAAARRLRDEPFAADRLLATLRCEIQTWSCGERQRREASVHTLALVEGHPAQAGVSLRQWWSEVDIPGTTISGRACRALITGRFVRPSWPLIAAVPIERWVAALPAGDPLSLAQHQLTEACGRISWASAAGRARAVHTGLRLMLASDYDRPAQLVDEDLRRPPPGPNGTDILDAALCELGVFKRSPRRGTTRHHARPPRSIEELVAARVHEPFREVTTLYMTAYSHRISGNYSTVRTKIRSLAYFWRYVGEQHPEIGECRQVLPHHARGFVPWALATARTVQRSTTSKGSADRTTSYDWLVDVRSFFTDLCTWGTEPGSPLASHMPRAIPLTSHDLNSAGFAAARARTAARMTATVMDLNREIPNIRAFALRRWHEATGQLAGHPDDPALTRTERDRFWDWALLELLLTSGLFSGAPACGGA